MHKAKISEIFSSIQGEGIFLGAKQTFVRFSGCNLTCVYCDERETPEPGEYSAPELMKEVRKMELRYGTHHSVSLTGGEPLLQAEFLKPFLKLLGKNRGFKAYLETNGTLPHELSKIIDMVDIVAMDIKLPSSTGGRAYWAEHLEFLKISAKKQVFVKAVITERTVKEDIEKAVLLIKEVKKKIPLILQPATPVNAQDKAPGENRMLKFLDIGLKNDLDNIRVIPQLHKMLGIK